MGVWDNVKGRFGFGEQWEDEYINEEIAAAEPVSTDEGVVGDRFYEQGSPYASGAAPSAVTKRIRKPDLERASAASGTTLREVPSSATPDLSAQGADANAYAMRPTSFDEASAVADRVKLGTPVLLDLTLVSGSQQQRFIDFSAGLMYALEGTIRRTANRTYVLTPGKTEATSTKKRTGR
jgi:cell division inhibitor SepF